MQATAYLFWGYNFDRILSSRKSSQVFRRDLNNKIIENTKQKVKILENIQKRMM